MSNKNYTVYHLHTDLSNGVTNIDSVTKFEEYIDYATSLGMKALCFSEHGSVFQWVMKKIKIEKAGMKYIHAQEFYVTENIADKKRDNYHFVLIAKNYDGVCELNSLSSKAFNKKDGHFYYAPRITLDELFETSDNIIVTTACIGCALCKGTPEVQTRVLEFLKANNHRSFLEIQHHDDIIQKEYNKYLVLISEKYNIPLIAGTDTHALNKTHLSGRDILQKAKDVKFNEESNFDMAFKTYDELVESYKKQNCIPENKYLEAIDNTNKMADMVEEFELDYTYKYPKLYKDSDKVFKQKVRQAVIDKGIDKYSNYQEYRRKINEEYKTYKHNGSIDFLLLEEDYKTALRKQGVHCGYSRGSVSGSVIAYLLGITDEDSIKYNLNFERFMNQERVSLADVDTDWYKGDRWKVREYLYKRDGLYCCDIITFNTIAMKGAIKDVGRALLMTPEETQNISNMVQQDEKKNDYVEDWVREKYPLLFQYVDIVMGTIVSVGNHPAGLVVSPHDINPTLGTFYSSANENPISQVNMKAIDMLNYVKLDVLGLDCVGLINQTCEFANIPRLTPDNMDFDDINVWNSIADDTTMIFQFESDYAGDYLKSILAENTVETIKMTNPNFSYIDLMSMANGAIRPAGESYRNELSQGIYRDNGHKALNDFLAPTLGYLVYQEQIIEFLHKFCGFTMGEADIVRRGFAKKTGTDKYIPIIKNGGYLTEDNKHYIKGFIQTMEDDYNVDKNEAEKLIVNFLQVIIDASEYLFSKNHSDPYSHLGFACGYLRHYYLLEFLTAAMNIYKEDEEKSLNIKKYAFKKNIAIKPIKFRKSKAEYFMDKEQNVIYQGIESIKFCNSQIADELYELRDNQYETFIDLLIDIQNTSVNSRQLEILIKLNFFEEFGHPNKLLTQVELFNNLYGKKQFKKDKLDEIKCDAELVKKYAEKETEKMFTKVDTLGLLKELAETYEYPPTTIYDYLIYENECLGYITYSNSEVDKHLFYVTELDVKKTIINIKLHEINTGKQRDVRMWARAYNSDPFKQNDILFISSIKKENKKEPTGEINPDTGKKIYKAVPDKYEYWLQKYIVKDGTDL